MNLPACLDAVQKREWPTALRPKHVTESPMANFVVEIHFAGQVRSAHLRGMCTEKSS